MVEGKGVLVVMVFVILVVDSRLVQLLERFVLAEVRFVGVGLACNVSLESVGVVDSQLG